MRNRLPAEARLAGHGSVTGAALQEGGARGAVLVRVTPMRRSRRLPVALAFVAMALAAAGCGQDAPTSIPPSDAGPAARWRRAVDARGEGLSVVVEAVKPCRVTLAWRLETGVEGRQVLDLSPGDATRIVAAADAMKTPPGLPPPEADRTRGRTQPVGFLLRYSVDEGPEQARRDIVWTRDREPWTRIASAEVPPTWLDLPAGVEVPMVAVAVSDRPDSAGLRLDLATPPRIYSPHPPSREDVMHVASLYLEVDPR